MRCTLPLSGARVALLALLASSLPAQVFVTTVAQNGDPADVYDIVILGDGYRAVERAQFDADVADVIANLRFDPLSYPYGAYWNCYNVHSVFRASNESGADDPTAGVVRDTAYDASYNVGGTQRCLYLNTTAGRNRATADAALAPDTDGRVIVLVNSSQYGGCASTFSVSYNGSSMELVQSHEWGHSFGSLADEYDYGQSGTYTGGEFAQANVTNSSTGAKWQAWLGFAGQYGTVGAYEGARYYLTGVWRPEPNCMMRSLSRRNCTICREQIIKRFHRECVMIRDPAPATTATVQVYERRLATFSFANALASRPHSIEWRVDSGPWLPGAATFVWDTTGASLGVHIVETRLTDTSPDVRSDPALDLVHIGRWTVQVLFDPAAAIAYGSGCNGVTLSARTAPAIGSTLTLDVDNLPAATTAVALLLGSSPLDVSLDPIGMLGCRLLIQNDIGAIQAASPSAPTTSFSIPVANDPGAIGGGVRMQAFAIASGSNPLGVIASNGLTLTVGAAR